MQHFPQEALDKSRARKEEELRALREFQKEAEHLREQLRLRRNLEQALRPALGAGPLLGASGGRRFWRNTPVEELSPDKDRVAASVEALNELLAGARKGAAALGEVAGEALVFGLAASYLPALRQKAAERGLETTALPLTALLVGRAGAGKTTLLNLLGRLWGLRPVRYGRIEKTGGSPAHTIHRYMLLEEGAPLLIDEVNTAHLSEDRTLAQVLKDLGDDGAVGRCLVITSNLESFRGQEQILRRACFLPFEHKPHEGGSPRDFAQQVSEDLLLAFLREAYPGERELERLLQHEDPLEPARSFLRGLGVAVPERPVGDYREYMRRCWRSLYYTQREAFLEIEMPDARNGRLVPCFVVEKERVGFLTPLQAFDNGTAGNQQKLLLRKAEFLKSIEALPAETGWWGRLLGLRPGRR